MTAPHTQEPAEGPDDESAEDGTDDPTPSNPDKTGDSIDSRTGPADKSAGPARSGSYAMVPPDGTAT